MGKKVNFFKEANNFTVFGSIPAFPIGVNYEAFRWCFRGCAYCFACINKKKIFDLSVGGLGSPSKLIHSTVSTVEKADKNPNPNSFLDWYLKNRYPIYASNNSDIFVPGCEGVSRQLLEIFDEYGFPFFFTTKGIHTKELFKTLIQMSTPRAGLITITSLSDKYRKKYEPESLSPEERFELVAKLNEAGIPTGINVVPFLHSQFPTLKEIEKLLTKAKEVGAREVTFGALNFRGGTLKIIPENFKFLELSPPASKYYYINRKGVYANFPKLSKLFQEIENISKDLEVRTSYQWELNTLIKSINYPLDDEGSYTVTYQNLVDTFSPKIVPTIQMILNELRKRKDSEIFVFTLSEFIETAKEVCNLIAFPYSQRFRDIHSSFQIDRAFSKALKQMSFLEMLRYGWLKEAGHNLFEDYTVWKVKDSEGNLLVDENGDPLAVFLPSIELLQAKTNPKDGVTDGVLSTEFLKEFGIEFE
ncbi:DNA repair photolyase [Balnearium lithotrophicum]|uniref:DNA repair photolyase n=1 Tax=Balnearium lithotrophicum TaxID=223788 RepID=A0A521CJT6_9BACT|nr:radical SAM protein [Balnearium lithotrophicum]SMO59684.1 DNA repair photolyase [Balnearium lithotrophicum]